MPDLILTGLPRSGSTLTCHLLNRCADTVALHEPIPMPDVARRAQGDAAVDEVAEFFADTRRSLLETRRATSKLVNGQVPDNTFGAAQGGDGLRRSLATHGEVSFEGKDLTPDFTLAVKHNAGFTALLDRLTPRFTCFGLVRHPLAVLASWESVNLAVRKGHVPVGEQFNAGLRAALEKISDRTERQFYILEWFFDRFARLLPRASIVRYEDVIATGGRALGVVTPAAGALAEPLASKNKNSAYDAARVRELGAMLAGREGTFWDFYPRASVEEMLAAPAPS